MQALAERLRAARGEPRRAPAPQEARREGVPGAALADALDRALDLLTSVPAGPSPQVAGMPFSQAGVERLMRTLRERAEGGQGTQGEMAGLALAYLGAQADEPAVAGASIDKLRMLAARARALRFARRR